MGMSFRDLDGSKSGSTLSRQPKSKKDEETNYERSIKTNIQEIQESVRRASEQLEQANRSFLSKRISESLERFLERSRQLSQETEQLFRDWTVHLAGEPSERHRKKFSYEKLQKAFEEEVFRLKDVARRTVAAQQEERGYSTSNSADSRSTFDDHALSFCGEHDVEHGLLDDAENSQVLRTSLAEDVTIRNRIAQEREEGIRRIQTQVHEVNQIFRDLASMVQEQDAQFESIEGMAQAASSETKLAVNELRKAADRQRGSRERLCCMLTAAMILLFFVILPHLRTSELHYFNHSTSAIDASHSQPVSPVSVHEAASASPNTALAAPAGWRNAGTVSRSSPNSNQPSPVSQAAVAAGGSVGQGLDAAGKASSSSDAASKTAASQTVT